ncbi:MAG: calcium-binding protein [Chloroflexota bacterium]|nr:calcium-binding protein [Chloroflexota bacterium]
MTPEEEAEEREKRIIDEIVVDAYGEEERASGWYNYLDETLGFPFRARCVTQKSTSPLRVGEEVEALGMADYEACEHSMFIKIRWLGRELAVPLSQLQGIETNEETQQAIEDWRYWVDSGYEF